MTVGRRGWLAGAIAWLVVLLRGDAASRRVSHPRIPLRPLDPSDLTRDHDLAG